MPSASHQKHSATQSNLIRAISYWQNQIDDYKLKIRVASQKLKELNKLLQEEFNNSGGTVNVPKRLVCSECGVFTSVENQVSLTRHGPKCKSCTQAHKRDNFVETLDTGV